MSLSSELPSAAELITLDDGTCVTLRPIEPDDGDALLEFHRRLSDRSQYLRYFYPHSTLSPREVTHFTQVDGQARVALVLEQRGVLVAVGRYDRLADPTQAEVAFVVADRFQHRGMASLLLQQLATRARGAGITHLVADVLAENTAMLSVFHASGFPIRGKNEWGIEELHMAIAQ